MRQLIRYLLYDALHARDVLQEVLRSVRLRASVVNEHVRVRVCTKYRTLLANYK